MRRQVKQHAPIKFGEPFNPKSVDGVVAARIERVEARRWKRIEDERLAAIEEAKPVHVILWERLRGIVSGESSRPGAKGPHVR